MKIHDLIISSLAICVLYTSFSGATTVRRFDDQRLVESSESIVVGTVVDSWVQLHERWDCPVTYACIEVERAVKGSVKEGTVTVKVLGGTMGDISAEVPSSPEIDDIGMRVFVFMHDDPDRYHSNIIGWSQGFLEINENEYIEAKNSSVEDYIDKISAIVAEERQLAVNPFVQR
jgi:hypothetical protein